MIKKLNIPREKLVISTKLWNSGQDPKDRMFSRKRIIEGVNNCLKRLNLDYIDVLIVSRFDLNTTVEEVVRAVNYLINKGLVFIGELLNGQQIESSKLMKYVLN